MTKIQKLKQKPRNSEVLNIRYFIFVSDFDIRISDFPFETIFKWRLIDQFTLNLKRTKHTFRLIGLGVDNIYLPEKRRNAE